jgi:putative transposase
MNGKHHYLWRAVDQDGYTLDILVQPRRDRKASGQALLSQTAQGGS